MKIAIAGYGVEGKASYEYWSRDARNKITIVDDSESPKQQFPPGAETLFGDGALQKLTAFDLVVRSPGLAPDKIKTDGKIWSATNEFFAKCPAPIIGVTGTKGKGTVSTMIATILEAAGKKVHLVGNIGVPALGVLASIQPEDLVVFELSSFQLWDIEYSPDVAVVLGIEAEHLDVHKDMADYVAAKGHIRQYQAEDGVCIYHPTNTHAEQIAHLIKRGSIKRYGANEDGAAYTKDGNFMIGEHILCSTGVLQVPGAHNIENACAAITVAKVLAIPDEDIVEGLSRFESLPHRLEKVREFEGVTYFNDSFSSAPAATVAAIQAFTEPEVVIIGGVDRGADFRPLAEALAHQQNVKQVILIGKIRQKLARIFQQHGVTAKVVVSDAVVMSDIIAEARAAADGEGVILLSPGCASFDMFKDFYERGDQFREMVQNL